MKTPIIFTLECLPEDTEIEGNASAINPVTDARIVKEIRDELNSGNEWAWCTVKVTATIDGLDDVNGEDYLGCCSYKNEQDFKDSGYYKDMRDIAEKALRLRILSLRDKLNQIDLGGVA